MIEVDLAEDNEPILCGDRVLVLTSGTAVQRLRQLPGGREVGTITARNGVATDTLTGDEFRVRISGHFQGTEENGRGLFNAVLIGERGEVYRVQFRFRSQDGMQQVDVFGDCRFPDGP